MDIPCQVCGKPFPAKRASAMYCGERCKKRAQRNPGRPASGTPVPVRGQAPVAELRSATGRVAMLTEAALMEAGRIDTPLGAVAMTLAAKLDDPGLDTGSSIAALARQHQATLEKALDGAQRVETPLERLKRSRQLKAG